MKTLVLHDAFTFPGGGENVASLLARDYGAELYAGDVAPSAYPDGYFATPPRDLSACANHVFAAKFSRTLAYWRAFARFPKQKADVAVFSGSLAPLAHKRITAAKILYCHTPPRILYDHRDFYLNQHNRLKRPLYKLFLNAYENAWKQALADMDLVIANSKNVQKRLKTYLNAESEIVFPPCDTNAFAFDSQGDYYLSTARVDILKRVDRIARAFMERPDKKLIIVSGGSEFNRVRDLAANAPNIDVRGWVDDRTLKDLMANCIATVYIARDEDFGISPVESMAAGKPVIGVAEGGLLETVVHGETGLLLAADPAPEDIARAVDELTPDAALGMRRACERRAELFGEDVFLGGMRAVVEKALGRR